MSKARSEFGYSPEENLLFGNLDFDLGKGLLLIAKKGCTKEIQVTLDWLVKVKKLDIEKAINELKEQGIFLVDAIIKYKNQELALYLLKQKYWNDDYSKYKLREAFPQVKEKVGDSIAYQKNSFAHSDKLIQNNLSCSGELMQDNLSQIKNKKNKCVKVSEDQNDTLSFLFFNRSKDDISQVSEDKNQGEHIPSSDDWTINQMLAEIKLQKDENIADSFQLKYISKPGAW